MADVADALLAEFDGPEALADAVRRAGADGFTGLDAFGPFPMPAVADALGFREARVPRIGLVAGLAGLCAGFAIQVYGNWSYRIDIGGRPLQPIQSYMLVALEIGIFCAAAAMLVGLFLLCRLPRLNHPVFAVERFEKASRDGFFLLIPTGGNGQVADHARAFLVGLDPRSLSEVRP